MTSHLRTAALLLPGLIGLSLSVTPTHAQQPAANETAARCAALGGLDLSRTPDAVIQVLATTDVERRDAQAGYCEVGGYVAPSVGFALRLPSDHWNGKFIELGCAGACGFTAHVAACAEPVRRGYACIVSDGGHKARGDVKWAYNNPQAVVEYFVRASHVTAIAGKVIAERYYNQAPQKSYFMGCSAGGLQGTVEAQRFPWDFDGIVVGAPSLSLTGLWLNLMSANRALTRSDGEPALGPADLETLHQAVVASCDLNDGVKDGLIGDPRACRFRPSELLCTAGAHHANPRSEMPPANHPTTNLPPVGAHYDVGGRRIFLLKAGAGRPAAVFLPGGGMMGLGYYNVHAKAAELTTSVVYDRGGTGWSDPVPLPRTATEVVNELRGVLRAASVPAPYLFVGHSLGGLYARRFAQLWPTEVSGLLLLDPAHEDYSANTPESVRQMEKEWAAKPMPEFTPEQIQGFRPLFAEMLADWPAEIREALIDRHVDPAFFPIGMLEGRNADELYDEIRKGGPTPSIPLIVLTAMGIDASQTLFSSEDIVRAQNQAKLASHVVLVRSVPGAQHRVFEDASHAMFHTRRPDAVLEGIRDLLETIGR